MPSRPGKGANAPVEELEMAFGEDEMSLQDEIDQHRREIHTDSYQMSIGELINLYRDGELDIHPEYQRFFRWTKTQKSRFIESILLGIPLPSIFVAQRDDGIWDLVDGLQRVSTILEFTGDLRAEDGEAVPPLSLEGTKYLPSLRGKTWEGDDTSSLTPDQQRFIKRAKISLSIMLRESPEAGKYDLFQRLNTGGTFLTDQELRSALLVGTNVEFYRWLVDLAQYLPFKSCMELSERQIEEQYDLEMVVRFVVLNRCEPSDLSGLRELTEFLTETIIEIAGSSEFDRDEEAVKFKKTFDLLGAGLGPDAFRKYDPVRDRFFGAFSLAAFEVIGLGLRRNVDLFDAGDENRIVEIVKKEVWSEPDFLTSTGQRATQRLPRTLVRGRSLFGDAGEQASDSDDT